ncbi:hypothetical protein CGX12_13385 [Zobellella denitrificans]|uniref:RES family NAD+ phosphorylase n=1 Tax=Zobellella denitrificans TaxID=347534 RepID=UPI000B8C112A|nr:RES family NAD+ phosphorylase [Zobellella denitrificans]OXS14612.1 hypothetical protein CGX12_13385 [Zobellella denitrificans]
MSRLPEALDVLDKLPTTPIPAGSAWLRGSSLEYDGPLFFNSEPGGRFNPYEGNFGTLYLAKNLVGVLAETVCRGAAEKRLDERVVSLDELKKMACFRCKIKEPLLLLDFTVPNLAKYRLDARIYSEYDGSSPGKEYIFGPLWADLAQSLGCNGILYPSRHHTTSHCLALFNPPSLTHSYAQLHTFEHADVLTILDEEFDWGII